MNVEISETNAVRLQQLVDVGRFTSLEDAVAEAVARFVETDDEYEARVDARLASSRRAAREGRHALLTPALADEIKREGRTRLARSRPS